MARDAVEPAAFTEFAAARYLALVRTAFLLVGDRGYAEDLVQSALYDVVVWTGRSLIIWGELSDGSSPRTAGVELR